MALPIPHSGLVLPTFTEDRGSILFDPITKSTLQRAQAFVKRDTCDRPVYIAGTGAMSINQLINCIPVLAGVVSVSFLIPYLNEDGSIVTATNGMADLLAMMTVGQPYVQNAITDAITRGPSPIAIPTEGTGPGITQGGAEAG